MIVTLHQSALIQVRRFGARLLFSLPGALLERLAGDRAGRYDGPPLDPSSRLVLRAIERGPKLEDLGPVAARRRLANLTSLVGWRSTRLDSVVEESIPRGESVPPLRVRVLRPYGLDRRAPALIYLHGGGWVLGGLESHHHLACVLAARARCVVLVVDYRLAPEHPFPAAYDDTLAAYRWTLDAAERLGLDPERIALGGDSAGGNLAAAACLELRREARPPCAQLLIYPVTDTARATASYLELASGYGLERSTMDWFFDCYLPLAPKRAAALEDPRVAPLRASDFADLPPAVVGTAAVDILRDEGDAYAESLRAAGVEVVHRSFPGLIHGFANMAALPAARRAMETLIDDFAALL
ncbi:MAG: alpha/beta hydrolase [Acidobacteriota bacterium]